MAQTWAIWQRSESPLGAGTLSRIWDPRRHLGQVTA